MSDIKKQRLKKFAKFFLVKFPIFIGIILLLMIVSLKMVVRYPDPLRDGFQEYLSEAYNANVTIGKLDKISFFPIIDVHATNVTMHDHANAAIVHLNVDSIIIRSPFWSMLMNTGRLNALKIDNLESSAGFIFPKSLEIQSLNIIDREGPEQYGSFIVAEGKYDNKIMKFEAEIEKLATSYKVGKDIPFSLRLGEEELNGLVRKKLRSVEMVDAVYTVGDKASTAQNFILYEDKMFTEDNPLYCILHSEDVSDCEEYIK